MINLPSPPKKNYTIDFCLFGNYTHFLSCIILNIKKINNYDQFAARVYVDLSVTKQHISRLERAGAIVTQKKIVVNSFAEGCMLRYGSILKGIGRAVIVRDADSLISDYEFSLILDWLNSDYNAHTIRNNIYHAMPIMGGLFGIKKKLYNDFIINYELMHKKYYGNYGGDQIFLAKHIYPLYKKDLLVFSSCYVYPFENALQIKSNLSDANHNSYFIGAYYKKDIMYRNVGKRTLPFYFFARLIGFRFLRHLSIPGWHFIRRS